MSPSGRRGGSGVTGVLGVVSSIGRVVPQRRGTPTNVPEMVSDGRGFVSYAAGQAVNSMVATGEGVLVRYRQVVLGCLPPLLPVSFPLPPRPSKAPSLRATAEYDVGHRCATSVTSISPRSWFRVWE